MIKKTGVAIILSYIFFLTSCSTMSNISSSREKKLQGYTQENTYLSQIIQILYGDGQYKIESLSNVQSSYGNSLLFFCEYYELKRNTWVSVYVNFRVNILPKISSSSFNYIANRLEKNLFFLVGIPLVVTENEKFDIIEAYSMNDSRNTDGSSVKISFDNSNSYSVLEIANTEEKNLFEISNNKIPCAYVIQNIASDVLYLVDFSKMENYLPSVFLDISYLEKYFSDYPRNCEKIILPDFLSLCKIVPINTPIRELSSLQKIKPSKNKVNGKFTEVFISDR